MENEEILDQYTVSDIDFIKKFLYKETADHILIKSYIGQDEVIVIPDTFKNKPVTFVDRGFFNVHTKYVKELIIGDNLISFYSPLKEAPSITKVKLGEKLNCIESLIKDSNVEKIDLGKNTTYRYQQDCLISKNGENLIWNKKGVKKVPFGIVTIGAAAQFYDSIFIPDTVLNIHVSSFRSKKMDVYYGGRKIQWVNIHILRTLSVKDFRKGRYDNEIYANTQEKKFRKGKNKVRLTIKYNMRLK